MSDEGDLYPETIFWIIGWQNTLRALFNLDWNFDK